MHLKDLFAQTLSLVYRFIFPQEDMEHATHLQTTERWQEALNESDNRLLFLFKHSTTWPKSTRARRAVETLLDNPDHRSQLNSYWLRVREDRPVSDAVEEDLGVKHESPQAFLIRNGNALWHDSHDSITEDTLRKALQSEISKDG